MHLIKKLTQCLLGAIALIMLTQCTQSPLGSATSTRSYAPGVHKNIALLLPLQGPMGSLGNAVRNGFVAAYYADAQTQSNLPPLKIYDTSTGNIVAIYQQAVQAGADFVVGPLLKNHLQQLINKNSITVPTLALNTLPTIPDHESQLFQFGLSPLDEAQQAANRAWQQGAKNAAILLSNPGWSNSIASVFAHTWTGLGGHIVTELTLESRSNLDRQIKSFLQVRGNQRRQDIDVIYLITDNITAQQVIPLLNYYYAGAIPVYSISQLYDAKDTNAAMSDLDGIYFCDMPWVLNPNNESQALQKLRFQIETIWPDSYANNKKLYALGIDAYTITMQLKTMQQFPQTPVIGATGDLYLDQNQHIYRKLPWAQFKNGVPVLLPS